MPPERENFDTQLEAIFEAATDLKLSYIGVNSGQLHRLVGGYPDRNHRMPVCCASMRDKIDSHVGDRIISTPPQGDGASLLIHYVYVIPRRD